MNPKKTKILKIIGVLLVAVALFLGGFMLYGNYQMSKLAGMSFDDCLFYTTKDDEDVRITIGIIQNGKMEYTVYGNNASVLSQEKYTYEIGSLTKTFTTCLISKAISEGKMNLNDRIDAYLDIPPKDYYPTLKRLVTHISGYKAYYFDWQMVSHFFSGRGNDFYGISVDSMLNKVSDVNLENKNYPWLYSNFGLSVAGEAVSKVYGEGFRSLMNNFIINDLHLKNTKVSEGKGDLKGYWQWKEDDAYLPAGSLLSDITDMMEYCRLHMSDEIPYLTRTHDELINMVSTPAFYEKVGICIDGMGMGWILDRAHGIIWHNGGTSKFNSYLGFDKERQIGVVILSNLGPNERIPATIIGTKLILDLQQEYDSIK